jgi:hypothetical protein
MLGSSGSTIQLTTPASSGIPLIVQSQTTCNHSLVQCCPSFGYTCGMRYVSNNRTFPAGVAVSNTTITEGQNNLKI